MMKPDQERVKNLLTDTVTLLCKNGLTYRKELKVQGLLGITTDEEEVFIVHINEKFGDMFGSVGITVTSHDADTISQIELGDAVFEQSTRDKVSRKEQHVDLTERKERSTPQHRLPEKVRSRKRHSQDSSSSPKVSSPSASPSHRNSSYTQRSAQPSPSASSSRREDHRHTPVHSQLDSQPTVKIKQEDEVLIIDEKPCRQISGPESHTNRDHNAMQQSYGPVGLSLEEIQSGFPQFEAIDNNVSNEMYSETKPPVAKRRSILPPAGGSTSDSDIAVSVSGPFITGMVQNYGTPGDGDGQAQDTSWKNTSLGPVTEDGEVLLEGSAGCSSWDSSQLQMERSQGSNQMGENSESLHSTAESTQEHLYPLHSTAESTQEHLYPFERRPNSTNMKSHRCEYPSCGLAFYYRRDLLRHQTRKHGRKPVWTIKY